MAKTKKMPTSDLERLDRRARRRRGRARRRTGACSSHFCTPAKISCLSPLECFVLLAQFLLRGGHAADRLADLVDRARDDEPEQQGRALRRCRGSGAPLRAGVGPGARRVVDRPGASRPRGRSRGRRARSRSSASRARGRRNDRHGDDRRDERAARGFTHAVVFSPCAERCKPGRSAPAVAEAMRVTRDAPDEEVYFDARRHGVVLARPLAQAVVLAAAGGILLALPWPRCRSRGGARRARALGLPARGLAAGSARTSS